MDNKYIIDYNAKTLGLVCGQYGKLTITESIDNKGKPYISHRQIIVYDAGGNLIYSKPFQIK